MNSLNFNIDNGYLEGLVRGFKGGILKQTDYLNLIQCETLEGIYLCSALIFVFSFCGATTKHIYKLLVV